MNFKKQLQIVNDKIKTLANLVDKMIAAVGMPEKTKATTPKSKPPVKKAPTAKKKTVKAPPAPVKESSPLTAADAVLSAIKESKGIKTAALMEKTGYNEKKIQNIVFKLKKQGKIKSIDKGVYVGA